MAEVKSKTGLQRFVDGEWPKVTWQATTMNEASGMQVTTPAKLSNSDFMTRLQCKQPEADKKHEETQQRIRCRKRPVAVPRTAGGQRIKLPRRGYGVGQSHHAKMKKTLAECRQLEKQKAVKPRELTWCQVETIAVQNCVGVKATWERYMGFIDEEARVGPQTLICFEMENQLAKYVEDMGDAGFGYDWGGVKRLAGNLLVELQVLQAGEKEDSIRLGSGWLAGFKRRYPHLTRRRATYFERIRAGGMNPGLLDKYFRGILKTAITKVKAWNRSEDIAESKLNLDETAVQSEPNNAGYVVVRVGSKRAHKFSVGKGLHNTLVDVIFADVTAIVDDHGNECPFWIVSGARRDSQYAKSDGGVVTEACIGGDDAYVAMSEKGYMTDEIWEQEFVPWLVARLKQRRIQRGLPDSYWFLLIMDGYGAHTMTPAALRAMWHASVYAICFPSHTSTELQALDKGIFAVLKHYFKQLLDEWLRENLGVGLTKWVLLVIFFKAVKLAHNAKNIKSSFKAVGVKPFDENWVENNKDKLAISTYFAQREAEEECSAKDSSSKFTAAMRAVRYTAAVADFGPDCLVSAFRSLQLNPHVDSVGVSAPVLQRLVQETDQAAVCAVMHRAGHRVFKKPGMKKPTAKAVRKNMAGESFSEAKWLNEPERCDKLDDAISERQKATDEKEKRQQASELQHASEMFVFQTLKKLNYISKDAKKVTLPPLNKFIKQNAVVVAVPPNEKKKRCHIVAAVQQVMGHKNETGFWNDDLSARVPHVDIPATYQIHKDPNVSSQNEDENNDSEVEDEATDHANQERLALLATNASAACATQGALTFHEYIFPPCEVCKTQRRCGAMVNGQGTGDKGGSKSGVGVAQLQRNVKSARHEESKWKRTRMECWEKDESTGKGSNKCGVRGSVEILGRGQHETILRGECGNSVKGDTKGDAMGGGEVWRRDGGEGVPIREKVRETISPMDDAEHEKGVRNDIRSSGEVQVLRWRNKEKTPTKRTAREGIEATESSRERKVQYSRSEQSATPYGGSGGSSHEAGDPEWLTNLRRQMGRGGCAYPAESALATASASCNRKEVPDRKFDSRSKEGNVENKKKKTEKQTEKWKKQQQAGLREAREYCEGEVEVPARKRRRWQYRNWNMVVEIEQMNQNVPFSSPTEGR